MNSNSSNHTCPVCGSEHFEVFFEMQEIPVFCNILWSDKSEANNCNKGDIKLAFCDDCGFIGNVAFDPSRLEYTQVYENSLDFSPRFQDYAKSLALRLIETHDLRNKDVIEIGCGKGDFLYLLCELGNNRGVGFDPSYVPLEEHQKIQDRMQIIQDYYSDKYANYASDFICCRHTLEHVPQPIHLLQNLRQAIGERENTAVFFEVPNALDTFRDMAIWDIIYEHCCYFAPISLSRAFSTSGFKVNNVTEEYKGQFLCLESQPGEASTSLTEEQSQQLQQLANNVKSFNNNFGDKVKTWVDKLEYLTSQGKRVVVWGAGSKGVTFLNLLQQQGNIEYIVDLNPRKHRMYVAGTGQEIVPPQFLQEYQPDVILIMNHIYENEIQKMTADMGLNPQFLCV